LNGCVSADPASRIGGDGAHSGPALAWPLGPARETNRPTSGHFCEVKPMVDSGHFPSLKLSGASEPRRAPEHGLLNVCLSCCPGYWSLVTTMRAFVTSALMHFDPGLREQRMSPLGRAGACCGVQFGHTAPGCHMRDLLKVVVPRDRDSDPTSLAAITLAPLAWRRQAASHRSRKVRQANFRSSRVRAVAVTINRVPTSRLPSAPPSQISMVRPADYLRRSVSLCPKPFRATRSMRPRHWLGCARNLMDV